MKRKSSARDTSIDRRRQILETATAILLKKNYHTMKTADIAKKADISEGTIYRYFKSKKAILLEVISTVNRMLAEIFFEGVSQLATVRENVTRMSENFRKRRLELSGYYKILNKAFAEIDDPQVKKVLNAEYQTVLQKMDALIQWGIEKGELAVDQARKDSISLLLWGVGELLWKRELVSPTTNSLETVDIDTVLSTFFGVMFQRP